MKKISKYLKSEEEQIATKHDKEHAKWLAKKFAGKYGFMDTINKK